MSRSLKFLVMILLLIAAACAQAPKESVELSVTVGRDIVQVYKAHRELALILYGRMEKDINKFVDGVYAPYLIKKLLKADHDIFKSGDPNSMFSALDKSIKKPNSARAQKDAIDTMDVFVKVVRKRIEGYRKKRLEPIMAQKEEMLSAIDRAYNQIHYANSIVTGYLASIVKVHDAQSELLKEFGLEGIREEVGQNLARTSNKVAEFTEKAKRVEGKISDMDREIKRLTQKLDDLVNPN